MNEKLKIYGENGEDQSQMNSSVTKKCFKSQRPAFAAAGLPTNLIAKRATYEFFSALFSLLVESGAKRSMPIENWAVLRRFFLISKRRKTALQLNRTETLKPGKKNARVILFTYRRA